MDIFRIILSSLFSIAALFILTRLIGYRQIAQMTLFDYCNGITIGNIAAEMATDLEHDVWYPLTAMVVYTLVILALAKLTNVSLRARRIITGRPIILLDKDELIRENFRKASLDLGEFMMQARNAGYFDLSQLQSAVLEANGRISFLPKAESRPLTAKDISQTVSSETLLAPLIMDGEVLHGNLRASGKEEVWLTRGLQELGYASPGEIFLAFCDDQDKLHIYPRQTTQKVVDFLE